MNLRLTISVFLLSPLLLAFSCNKQSNTDNTKTTSVQFPQQTIGQNSPSVTSATIKKSESGTGLEKYATKEAKESVAFNVSSDKLEAIINDAKIQLSFGVPKEYQIRPYNTLPQNDIARKFTEFTNSEISSLPLYSFSNGVNSMVVSQIQTKKGMSLQEFINNYELLNRGKFVPATLSLASFKNKDIPMTQFTIQENESGLIRIIMPSLTSNKFFQFDYTIRRTSFQSDMERIEPSVGSIMRIGTTANP